jgi:hypothetical protein
MEVRARGHHCSDRLPDPRLRSRIGITVTQNHPRWISQPTNQVRPNPRRFSAVSEKASRTSAQAIRHDTVARSTGRLPLTGAEWAIVAVFGAASFALFGRDAVDAAAYGRVYLGAATATAQDSMQYLAWATDAAHHGLIANLYGFDNGGHVFFHPIWLVTGLLHIDAGVSYPLLLGLWQAAALILLVTVLRRYAHLVLGNDARARAISLTLALFLVSPFFLFVVNLHFNINGQWTSRLTGESYAVHWISGYFPIALTVTAMIGYLIALERLMGTLERPTLGGELLQRAGFAAAALGATAALLHPWQGTELAVLTVGVAIWDRLLSRRNIRLLLPVAGIALPLLYYLILPKIDAGWATSGRAPDQPGIPLLGWLTTFGPVVLASIPGWQTRATSDRQRLLRLWPIAVLITFVAVPTGKYQAFAGVSVPLALLAVQGWRRVLEDRRRLGGHNPWVLRFLITAGVVVLVFGAAPSTMWLLTKRRLSVRAVAELDRPDADALDYLARQPRGGVLSTPEVGIWVPALTDNSTYVGHLVWSPQWARRRNYVSRLFDYPGKRPLSQTAALALIGQPGARYVLEPCGAPENLWPLLKPRGYSRHVFSCATVYSRGRSASAG